MNKRFYLSSLFLCLCLAVQSQSLLKFKISRPYCLLNFIETAKGGHASSITLRDSILSHTKGDKAFAGLVQAYQTIQLDYQWNRENYPKTRRHYRTTYDLIQVAAVQSETIEEFINRIVGIIPNSDLLRLRDILKKIDPYYEKIIWQTNGEKIINQVKELEKFQGKANDAFLKLKKLYNTSWHEDLPFNVAIYPIEARKGQPTHTTATVYANSLCVSVLTTEKDYAGRMGVILHEIAHALYDEQSPEFQHQLETYFDKIKTPYTEGARNYFNEAMATACGQGWVFKQLTGRMDTTSWYADEYIEGFGKVLYPMVTDYIEKNKSIDEPFIQEAIRLFGVTFPKFTYDIKANMNKLHLYINAEGDIARNQQQGYLFEYFNISSLNTSSPISDKESIEDIKKTSSETLFFMIDKDEEKTFKTLKSVLPDLKKQKFNLKEDFILGFLDAHSRMIIILKSPTDKMKKGLERLDKHKFIENNQLYITF